MKIIIYLFFCSAPFIFFEFALATPVQVKRSSDVEIFNNLKKEKFKLGETWMTKMYVKNVHDNVECNVTLNSNLGRAEFFFNRIGCALPLFINFLTEVQLDGMEPGLYNELLKADVKLDPVKMCDLFSAKDTYHLKQPEFISLYQKPFYDACPLVCFKATGETVDECKDFFIGTKIVTLTSSLLTLKQKYNPKSNSQPPVENTNIQLEIPSTANNSNKTNTPNVQVEVKSEKNVNENTKSPPSGAGSKLPDPSINKPTLNVGKFLDKTIKDEQEDNRYSAASKTPKTVPKAKEEDSKTQPKGDVGEVEADNEQPTKTNDEDIMINGETDGQLRDTLNEEDASNEDGGPPYNDFIEGGNSPEPPAVKIEKITPQEPIGGGPDRFQEAEDSHFFFYFLTSVTVFIVGYVAFHNKNKILAYALEGKRSRTRRRPNSANYRKLDSNLEEAIASSNSHPTTQIVY